MKDKDEFTIEYNRRIGKVKRISRDGNLIFVIDLQDVPVFEMQKSGSGEWHILKEGNEELAKEVGRLIDEL